MLGCVLLVGCGPEVRWRHARAPPFTVRDGLQIAKGSPFTRRRSLDLICDPAGVVHLLLHTRLPIPREFRQLGRDDDVVVFVDGIERRIVVAIVAITPVDEIVSPVCPTVISGSWRDRLDHLARAWFSVVGIHETGVEMHCNSSGDSIARFAKGCTADAPAS